MNLNGISPDLAAGVLATLKSEAEKRRRSLEMAEEYRGSFRKFVEGSWPTVEPSRPFIKAWHIDAIADHVQAAYEHKIQNLLITVPPGSAKSVICSVDLPAWIWTKDPGFRSTYLSYDDPLSTRDSVRCRGLLESVWYQETFRPSWKFATDQNEKTYYVNSEKGFRVAGKGTGWRSHMLVYDDPLNAKDRFSDLKLAGVVDDWENVLFNRFVQLATAIRIVIMQRLGDRDLAGHWLRKGGVEHLKIPLEYDPTRSKVTCIWEDPRKDPAVSRIMCPELFPPAVVEDLKLKPEAWASQYQQEPNTEGGGILKSHKWNYWQPAGLNLPPVRVKMPDGKYEERTAVELPDSFDLVLQSWDCAFKDLKTSDPVCGQVHAVRGARRFILDQIMRRMGIVDTMAAVRELTGRHPKAHLKLVEDKANGTAVVEMLNTEVPGLVLVNPEGGKIARAAAVSPELEAGNWFLPHPMIASWVGNPENPTDGGFLASTTLFPFGAHDDDVDSWSQAGIQIQKERIGGVFGISEKDIRVEPFEFDAKWPRLYGLAVTWKEVATVWMCRRPETDAHFIYAEYCVPPTSPAQHTAEIQKPGDWIQGVMTPTDTGRDEKDGYALVGKYRALKLKIDLVAANEESMILDLQQALREGKLKVFSNMPRLFDQFRMYRRDDKGKLPVHNCGVMKAMSVVWAGRAKMRPPAEPPKPDRNGAYRQDVPANTWMGS